MDSLGDLPLAREAFREGKLSWSALREITRVACGETEAQWLRFSAERTFEALRAEVEEARKKGRKLPRKGAGGLPGIRVRVVFEYTPEEHEVVSHVTRCRKREPSFHWPRR